MKGLFSIPCLGTSPPPPSPLTSTPPVSQRFVLLHLGMNQTDGRVLTRFLQHEKYKSGLEKEMSRIMPGLTESWMGSVFPGETV